MKAAATSLAVAPAKTRTDHTPGPVSSFSPSRESLIDEFGELDRKLKLVEPTRKRHDELKGIIKGWYDQFPGDRAAEEEGASYKLIVSPREMEATPKKTAIFKKAGKVLFLELCSVTQSAIKKAWGESSVEEFFTRERTGSRKLTVVAKSSPAA